MLVIISLKKLQWKRIKTAGLQARFRIYLILDQLRVYVMRQLCDICSINEMSDCINVYGNSFKRPQNRSGNIADNTVFHLPFANLFHRLKCYNFFHSHWSEILSSFYSNTGCRQKYKLTHFSSDLIDSFSFHDFSADSTPCCVYHSNQVILTRRLWLTFWVGMLKINLRNFEKKFPFWHYKVIQSTIYFLF